MSCLRESDDSSDYGSDFTPDEEQLLNDLLNKATGPATGQAATTSPWTPSLSSTPVSVERLTTPKLPEISELDFIKPAVRTVFVADIEDGVDEPSARLPKVLGREKPRAPWRSRPAQSSRWSPTAMGRWSPHAGNSSRPISSGKLVSFSPATSLLRLVEHPESTEGRTVERERQNIRALEWSQQDPEVFAQDTRTPLERFRQAPNKAFSVTDLVSPAWCELQYWYTLTKHGRKKRTAAMKKGSSMHKTLEDEIYTTVPVEIKTKEDAWGLRIWNVIQGLRMLREYGVTREMEVWGMVDGQIVNGIIDQLSYECPDSELESTAESYYANAVESRAALPEYQMSLSDYLLSNSGGGMSLSEWGQGHSEPEQTAPVETKVPEAVYNLPRIYVTDVKTKASRSVPTVKSSGFRPTHLQLHLYYHMLNRLVTSDDVTIDVLAARYNFDAQKSFTDDFVSEVGGLNDQFFDALSSQESETTEAQNDDSQDSTGLLLSHNNLTQLWSLMIHQLRLTFLPPADAEGISSSIPSQTQPEILQGYQTLISPVLTARYLSSAANEALERQHLGSRSFLFDPPTMTSYLSEQMSWWRGERDPRGVDVMDAWKCRICEFRDECSWRQEQEMAYARRGRGRAGSLAEI
ncbi:uncharacterized protein N7506_006728 [Penicillium brevicompactum]|uniref:uncharacterized protein n=1 Tax=Penicillium brevicompactum TaxID=5074 RepID=UPI002540D7FB|nr:uncharacterized protein N7506_006728 [Penicillium brevicompactum]KAJ5332945.1 hypothetical protein N7506_006728 [Penicillium brevicompactum]